MEALSRMPVQKGTSKSAGSGINRKPQQVSTKRVRIEFDHFSI